MANLFALVPSVNRRTRIRTMRSLSVESLESRQLMAVDSLQIMPQLHAQDEFLVQFRSPTPSTLIGQAYAGATVQRQLTDDGWFKIEVGANTTLTQAMAAYQERSDVIQATPDFAITAQAIPNDPSYGSLWGLSNSSLTTADIDADKAWDYGTSTSVITAVIDTGVDYRHEDLAANIWSNTDEVSGNGIDDDRNGFVDDTRGWDFAYNDNDPMDDNGHGTHVAGTIGAVGNNGLGVTGVAWSALIMPLKFLDRSGSGALSDAMEAINYARVNGAKVINASWGGGGFSSALQSAITQFRNAGGVFVAAAGNESANNAVTPAYPANYAGVISVGASTRSDTLASFSNYGTNVHIVAPGQSILSTLPGHKYGTMSGTSMATPQVAGAIALLWGQNPTRTAAQITDAIFANTDNVLKGSQSIHGRINLGKAAAALKQSTPPENPPTTLQQTKLTYSLQGAYALRDATTQATVHQFAFDIADTVTIADLDVVLNIQHTYASDLSIRLIGPDGTARTLVSRRGGSSDGIQLTLSDEATVGVGSLATLRGSARPEASLSAFDGKIVKGRWILQITDHARGDVGQLLGAQLVVTTNSTLSRTAAASLNAMSSRQELGSSRIENSSLMDSLRWALAEPLGDYRAGQSRQSNLFAGNIQEHNEAIDSISRIENPGRAKFSWFRQWLRRN